MRTLPKTPKPRPMNPLPPSLSPASKSVTMTSSDFKYLQAFGDEGLDHPQFPMFSFEPDFSGVSDPYLEYSKILAEVPVDEAMSPLSLLDPVTEFGLQDSQFPAFSLAPSSPHVPIAQSTYSGFDSSFDFAPSSPDHRLSFTDQFPASPFHPFSVGLPSESSLDHSDCDSVAAIQEQNIDSSNVITADRSYFKVDLEFPWQVYIRDPERLDKVLAWKKKKVRVLQEHKVKKNIYQVRTDVANRRMRVKGRFVGKCIS